MKKTILAIMLLLTGAFIYSQTTHTVNAGAYYYNPSELVINQGDIVIWINDQGFHDVNGETNSITNEPFNNPESFDSPATGEVGAEIYTHTFNVPGFYNYDCSVGQHAELGMVGNITVNPTPISTRNIPIFCPELVSFDNEREL